MANVVGYNRVFALLVLVFSSVCVLTNAAATPIPATVLEKRAGEKIQVFDLENICRISGSTSVMINNTMWINGGDINVCYSSTNCTTWTDISNYVIAVSFDKAYTNVQLADVEYKAFLKPRDVPVSTRGVLWRNGDGTKLYQFAGRITNNDTSAIRNETADPNQFWSYDIASDSWEYLSQSLSPSWDLFQVSIPEHDMAFSFGSWGGLPYQWRSSLIQLDGAQSLDERLETTDAPTGDNDRGAMMHLDVPGKDKGLLLLTGGHHATEAGDQPDASFEFVRLYDIETKTWYNQSTSTDGPDGSYPNPRHNYCAQVVSKSNGSWDIFMYGGDYNDVYNKNTLNGLWILSVPTFRWFYFPDPSSAVPLSGTTCQAIGSHFIVFGGWNYWRVSPVKEPNCTESFRVFDLNKWQWTNSFDPNADPYNAPTNVTEWKDANNAPANGWDTGVQALFAGMNASSVTTASASASASATPSASETPVAEKSSGSKLGPILGGVLGGLVGVGAVLVGILFLIKRKKQKNAEERHEIGDESKIYVEMPAVYIPQQPPSELPAGDTGHYAPSGPPSEMPSDMVKTSGDTVR